MKEMVTVLEDECGGGVVATIGRYFNAYRVGYVDEKTISNVKIKRKDENGQLYFNFINDDFAYNPKVSSKSFI